MSSHRGDIYFYLHVGNPHFLQEAGLKLPESLRHKFMEMFEIVEALKVNNLEPALE